MAVPTQLKIQVGFNIIGFATANLGLGVALRNTARLLESAGFSICILDLDPGGNRTGHDHALQRHSIQAGQTLPYNVNIFFMNPPAVESLLVNLPDLVETKGKFNVNISFWELPHLPSTWKPILEIMDLVLAPSKFIQTAMDAILTHTPCRYYQQALPAFPLFKINRRHWEFAPDQTVFLFSFDISSGMQKKNPLAVLQAFKNAFPTGGASLVFKVNNRTVAPEAGIVADRFKAVAMQVPGVRVIDEILPYEDVLSLYASADVFVSLHRAEGLGLSLMEFMAMGKPVIATAWSGNMDFMDEENSCLVPYVLVPLDSDTQYFAVSQGVSQVWADPDLNVARDWMIRLAQSTELREKIGQKGKQAMEKLRESVGKCEVFHEIQSLAAHNGCV